ncbi:MAG: putative colanic acid biosynthesis acetyltransferase [Sphingomonadales bacterium]
MVDVAANRSARKWSRRELAGRIVWVLATPLFALSPRPLWGWRRLLLRLFGARIGRDVHIYPSVRVTIPWNVRVGDGTAIGDRAILYALGQITIGARVTVSQQAHLCAGTHDWRQPDMPLVKMPIRIGDDAWICADAFIGPGVTVGAAAIVGARAVAVKDVPPGVIVGGNPARVLRPRNHLEQAAQ